MNNRLRLSLFSVALIAFVFITVGWRDEKVEPYHSYEEILSLRAMVEDLPFGENENFLASGKCSGCHGHDPAMLGNITEGGWDVNPTDFWRSSIMANSARDPFWRAKVTHEVAVNPGNQIELEDKCTACHAPMGKFNAHMSGFDHYSFAELLADDSVAVDGVSCSGCHQQSPVGIGNSFSGELTYVTDTIFGPFGGGKDEMPIVGQPMTSFVGFEPLYGAHIQESELCAGCHTLITNTADLEGNATGNTFVEQATYHEWLNSDYANDVSPIQEECQGCHFPRLDEEVLISANYAWLEPRGPIGLHYMVGANTFMLEMLRDNAEVLGATATTEQFDSTIVRTLDMLQNQSVDLLLEENGVVNDSLVLTVRLENNVGHKFPSGYPSRRAFIEFTVIDPEGNTLFQSGKMQEDYEVFGQNDTYEPHYDVITDAQQVQIYEQVLGDVNGNVTTVLERADEHLKDNRLVPKGFSTSHSAYDTTSIGGLAQFDLNFNFDADEEGSGTDEVTYKIDLDGLSGDFTVSAKLFYQSAPPKWMEEMFSISTPQIDLFKAMYEEQGAAPVLIDEMEINVNVTSVEEMVAEQIQLYPNPTVDGLVRIQFENGFTNPVNYSLFFSNGQLIETGQITRDGMQFQLPEAQGTYLMVFNVNGTQFSKRLLKM